MTRKDKILVIVVVIFSLAGFAVVNLPGAEHEVVQAVIRVNGEVVNNIDLSVRSDSKIDVKGPLGVSVLEVKGSKLRMLSSPCPDKVCVHQGWVGKPGETVVCVPNAVSVSIEGDGGVDAIIR